MEDRISRRSLFESSLSFLVAGKLLRSQQDSTFSTDVNVVNVFATVRDKKGQIVRNLTKDDFTLAEDGRPQSIRYFSQESGLPLTLGLLVDTSMSQRRVLGKEKDASYRFLNQVLREDKDHAFLIHFDREVELLQDLTRPRKAGRSARPGGDAGIRAPEWRWRVRGWPAWRRSSRWRNIAYMIRCCWLPTSS